MFLPFLLGAALTGAALVYVFGYKATIAAFKAKFASTPAS